MPRVQFVYQAKDVRITKNMAPPERRICDPESWLRAARKVIPEIPTVDSNWFILSTDVHAEWITFSLVDSDGNKCAVVIDRTYNNVTNTRL